MNREALSKSSDISRIVRDDIRQILDETDRTSVVKLEPTFKSVLNQPERVAISSTSAIPATEITSSVAETSFYSFAVNLPRPALNVKNIQLFSANIPQAQVCIPDDSLVFWYYRLQTQNIYWTAWNSGSTYNPGDYVTYNLNNYVCIQTTTNNIPSASPTYWDRRPDEKYESPNLFNLYCVRLLPSYYKKELLIDRATYGYNSTFNSYEELEAQLKVACENIDLARVRGAVNTIVFPTDNYPYMPQIENDISLTYNAKLNKFLFEGLNVNTPFAIPDWDATTFYPSQSLVVYLGQTYYNYSAEITYPPDSEDPQTSWTYYPNQDNADTVWNTYLAAGYNDPNVIQLQGTEIPLYWNEYHRFLPGSRSILYKGNYWQAALTNQNTPPPIGVWNATTLYSVGDVVYYTTTDLTYTCVLAPGPPAPLWSSFKKYYLGDRMTWEDSNDYEAAFNYIPIGWSPGDGALETTTWDYQQFSPGSLVSAWDYITYDPSGNPVYLDWVCTAQTTGLNPFDYPLYSYAAYYAIGDRIRYMVNIFDGPYNFVVWEALESNHALSPYEAPWRWQIVATVLPPAQAPEYWQAVTIPDPPWINLGAGKTPSNPTYWAQSYNPWIPDFQFNHFTGINAVSSDLDFNGGLYGNSTGLLGIPGQPFINTTQQSVVNNETLNKRLGFSWTGQNMVIPFTEIQKFEYGNLITLFYNRLRPVPRYTRLLGLELSPADTATIYTADAFCNLVYSSVVNIYTRLLGGSTTDTIRNTNLLAIVPVTCGNLGVTLYNSYMENPLTKVDNDIYTIELEFRTESGQPYWFSNNAVITFQLKLGY